jgi:hypothetical protein
MLQRSKMLRIRHLSLKSKFKPLKAYSSNLMVYFCFLSIVLSTYGCGKKALNDSRPVLPTINPQRTDLEVLLEKQEISCSPGRACPPYISKVVAIDGNNLKHCTGFLTDSETIVTSSSCLPNYLRVKGQDCSDDVFFYFEDAGKTISVGCTEVLEVSQLDSRDYFLWRHDVIFLKLKKPLRRRSLTIERSGFADLSKYIIWSVDQINEFQSEIRRSEECEAVHNTYFNPLVTNESSPLMTVAGCQANKGNSGSPVIDYRGKLRGVVSSPVDPTFMDRVASLNILEKPLKKIIYVSNFACAPSIYDSNVLNEMECSKDISINILQRSRDELLNTSRVFNLSLKRLEASVNEKNKFFRLGVRLSTASTETSTQLEVFPRCFKNVSSWIEEFKRRGKYQESTTFGQEIPVVNLKIVMDEFGRIKSSESIKQKIWTSFRFSPSSLGSKETSDVMMWVEGTPFEFIDVNSNCSLF